MYYTPRKNLNNDNVLIHLCMMKNLELQILFDDNNNKNVYVILKNADEKRIFKDLKNKLSAYRMLKLQEQYKDKSYLEIWVMQLSRLSGISEEEAKKIALEKIKYQNNQVINQIQENENSFCQDRLQLIEHRINTNALPPLVDSAHARRIIDAYVRHKSNYEELLKEDKKIRIKKKINQKVC